LKIAGVRGQERPGIAEGIGHERVLQISTGYAAVLAEQARRKALRRRAHESCYARERPVITPRSLRVDPVVRS
jgi:hypothetical protein